MQAPTHFCAGVLVEKATGNLRPGPLRYSLVVSLAVLSHGLLDRLARCTYHPPAPLAQDWFWIGYHAAVAILGVYVFFAYWKDCKVGLVASVLPDFDWILIHGSRLLSVKVPLWKEPHLHKLLGRFMDLFPPSRWLHALPDWTHRREAALLELALLAVLLVCVHAVRGKEGNPPTPDSPH